MSLWGFIGGIFALALAGVLLIWAIGRVAVYGLPGLRRESIEDDCGDGGGYARYGLERPDCDKPGRVEILPRRAGD